MLTNRVALGSIAPEDSDVIHIDSVAAFEQAVLQAGKPVLVDFYSITCAPCRKLSPTIETLATQYKDRAGVVKVNVDKLPELAAKYNIYGIPAILIFSNGEETKRIIGYNAKKTYTAAFDELL
jgi:thioredoxin 1